MTDNQIIIAILENAIARLWDGVSVRADAYQNSPEYMCHAVEFAIVEVVYGKRGTPIYIGDHPLGRELEAKIRAKIPGSATAKGYCIARGIYEREKIQAFRKQTLEAILAKYKATGVEVVKPSELARKALAYLGKNEYEVMHAWCKSEYACSAVRWAAQHHESHGRTGVSEAANVVKAKIAQVLGIELDDLGGATLRQVLIRLLGEDFVEAKGMTWMQQLRVEMLERIANELEGEGK